MPLCRLGIADARRTTLVVSKLVSCVTSITKSKASLLLLLRAVAFFITDPSLDSFFLLPTLSNEQGAPFSITRSLIVPGLDVMSSSLRDLSDIFSHYIYDPLRAQRLANGAGNGRPWGQ